MSDTPSKALQERMGLRVVTPDMVSPLGGPYPEGTVLLSDGTEVTESVFGRPPADLPFDQLDEWYADRDEELVSANLGDLE